MKMILTVTAKQGRARDLMMAMKAGQDYMTSKFGVKEEVFMQMGGAAGTICVIMDFQDMAAVQAMQPKLMADDKYWEMVQKSADLMVGPPTMTFLQPV